MSITVDYFFDCDGDLATIAEQANMSIDCSLLPDQRDPNDMYCKFFRMDFGLAEKRNLRTMATSLMRLWNSLLTSAR